MPQPVWQFWRLMAALGEELAAVHDGFGSNARLDRRICDQR